MLRHPTAGSFLKRSKADFGVSFVEALYERYGRIEEANAGVNDDDMFVIGLNQKTFVDFVGAEKINQRQCEFKYLNEAAFRNCTVNGEPRPSQLEGLLPNVKLLDISNNLLPSWSALAKITAHLPKLHFLNVG